MLECRCFSRARPARTLVLDHPRPLNLMGPGYVRTVGPSPFASTFASVPRLRTASTHSPRPSCYLPRPGYTPSVSPASTPTSFTSSITSTALSLAHRIPRHDAIAFRVAHAGYRCTAHCALAPLLVFMGCHKLGALDGPAVHDIYVCSAQF